MKFCIPICLAMACSLQVRAEEPTPEIASLQQAAADFVLAYNNKDAAAIAALFLENGEITNLAGDDTTTGRTAIKAKYEEIFAGKDLPQCAVEVASVRLVSPNLAIEDGTFHLDPPGENAPARSITYTAVLQKNDAGAWQIASTRDLRDVTDAGGQLFDLAERLKGDWTCQKDGMRMDFAFGWDGSGKFLIGEMLTTTDDAEPLTTTIRIGWDGARKTITWWTFDNGGGFSKGDWTPENDGWIARSEGTTSNGEANSSNTHLTFDGKDTILWISKDRLVDGAKLPDTELRIVRQAPEPEPDLEMDAEPATPAESDETGEPADL